jgi:hypothetical protein
MTNRQLAAQKLENLCVNVDPQTILEYIINNFLSGTDALDAMESAEHELMGCDICNDEDEDTNEEELNDWM